MRLAVLIHAALILASASMGASAETVRVDGPVGPLTAEAIRVDGADHAVVIVPGSGPVDRDGNAPRLGMRSDSYKLLAEGLAAAGVASLRIDKRGFFGSATAIADPNDVTIAGYAEDARKWAARAAELAPCVWIAGHSEGGLVALVAAEAAPERLCGLILLSTPGRPIGRLMLEQLGAAPAHAAAMPKIEAMVDALEAGRRRDPSDLPPALQPMFSPGLQRYMIDLFAYDPQAVARQWTGPTLIVQGDADIQVKPHDADRLASALPQAQRADLSGATHMLKSDAPGQPLATYIDPSLPLHPGLIPALTDYLARHPPR